MSRDRQGRDQPGPTAFSWIRLENWRNFHHVDTALRKRVFLVGPNASGKSNFLDAFRFLRDIVSVGGGFREAIRARGGVSRLRCLAARQYPDVVIRVVLGTSRDGGGYEYELHFSQDSRRPLIRKESVRKNGEVVLSRPNDEDRADPDRLTQT